MSIDSGNPLTQADYTSVQRIKEIVRQTIPLCDKAERCGVNVQGQRETLNMMGEFANSVQREFFPNGSP